MRDRQKSFGVINPGIVESSPLRRVDPRTKLLLAAAASISVMQPLKELAVFILIFIIFMAWARLLGGAARQVWKIKWLLAVLFAVDWIFISHELALIITLRITLLALVFSMFFSTTTTSELCLALVWLRVPYRYAFSIGLAFHSLGHIDGEWRAILEAQKSRGAITAPVSWKKIPALARDMVSLTVPSIVLTARRAWAMTEAAYARGFDSPHRKSYYRLGMGLPDWALICLVAAVTTVFVIWR